MTILDDQIAVFRLALETEDRTPAERGALTRTARRLTRKWNSRARGGFGRPTLEQRRKKGRIDLLAEMNAEPVPLDWWPDEERDERVHQLGLDIAELRSATIEEAVAAMRGPTPVKSVADPTWMDDAP